MAKECKYYKQKKQVSYDGGVTWQDVVPAEYQKGALYEQQSQDCGFVPPVTQYRWVKTNDTTCIESPDPPTPTEKKLVATYSNGKVLNVDCNSSSTLTSGETKPSGYVASAMTSAIIGQCVTSIGEEAFYECSGLTSIDIPDSVTSIGESAFQYCSSLTSIVIPSGVTSIGAYAFQDCSGLTSIVIPNSVTSIDRSVFNRCISLVSVTIPNSVTSIGAHAFWNCSSLTSITIPNSVTTIGDEAFSHCGGLTSVIIGNNVTTIGEEAFYRCSGLTSVTIPDSVTSIGSWAFYHRSGLTSVTINATTPPTLGSYVFNITDNCPIYVPASSVNAYKTATHWSEYASHIQAIP